MIIIAHLALGIFTNFLANGTVMRQIVFRDPVTITAAIKLCCHNFHNLAAVAKNESALVFGESVQILE